MKSLLCQLLGKWKQCFPCLHGLLGIHSFKDFCATIHTMHDIKFLSFFPFLCVQHILGSSITRDNQFYRYNKQGSLDTSWHYDKAKLKFIVVVTVSRFCCHCQSACYETSLKNVLTFMWPLWLQDGSTRNVSGVICMSDI